jgi:UPF0176 protein
LLGAFVLFLMDDGPETMTPTLNLAFYQFTRLEKDSLPPLRALLRDRARGLGLRGTLILAEEGLNAVLAGPEAPLRDYVAWLEKQGPFSPFDLKESWSDTLPFQRMRVKLKKEIIPLGAPGLVTSSAPTPRITSRELRDWIREKRDFVFLDTRNDYEIAHGRFQGAKDLGLRHFRDLPEKLKAAAPSLRGRKVVIYCTGGIRCEKAGPVALELGLDVVQLDGGILRYLEDCGSEGYDGDCFVFDERVAVSG